MLKVSQDIKVGSVVRYDDGFEASLHVVFAIQDDGRYLIIKANPDIDYTNMWCDFIAEASAIELTLIPQIP